MTSWKPPLRPGIPVGACALILLLVAEAFVLQTLFSRDFDLGSFLLALSALLDLALVAALAYLLYALVQLGYTIGSDALTLKWGPVEHIIPLSAITDVFSAYRSKQVKGKPGISWPGCYIGRGTSQESKNIVFFATSRSSTHVAFVVTPEVTYAISPRDRDSFINTLNRCRARPTDQVADPTVVAPGFFSLPYWQDHTAQALLLLALVFNVAVFAYVSYKFPTMPPILPLHFNVLGEIDFLGTRVESFKIPGIGLSVLSANFVLGLLLHSRERLATLVLQATAVLVQVVLLVATIKILV